MPWGAGIMAAGSIGSALIGANAASDASDKQAQAGREALALQKQIFDQNQSNLSPYINFGKSAVASLSDLYGLGGKGASGVNDAFNAFTNLPAYQFPFQQGMRALNANLNAQGKQQSGAEAKETQQFGQGLASQYLMSNYVNPLTQYAQLGAGAGGSLAGTNTTAAGQMGATTTGIGTAQASGIVGSANALSGGINNAAGSLGLYSMLAKNGGQPGSSGPGGGLSSYGNGQGGIGLFTGGGGAEPTWVNGAIG